MPDRGLKMCKIEDQTKYRTREKVRRTLWKDKDAFNDFIRLA